MDVFLELSGFFDDPTHVSTTVSSQQMTGKMIMINMMTDSIVNEAEVDVFLELSCFLYDPMDVGNLISHSSAYSISCLYIW